MNQSAVKKDEGTSYHFTIDVEGYLENVPESVLAQTFQNPDTGDFYDAAKARQILKQCLKENKLRLPIGACEGFSYLTGCPGHPTKKDKKVKTRPSNVHQIEMPTEPEPAPAPAPKPKIVSKFDECEKEIESIYSKEIPDYASCWITRNGFIIPVAFMGHVSKVYDLIDEGLLPEDFTEGHIEKLWVKVTAGMVADAIYHHGPITARQKVTLTKILEKHKDRFFKNQDWCYIFGKPDSYVAVLENGMVRFEKS